ncbi:hypothetical protein N9J85_00240 [bacterium]|nr:hypothetical protein [bacterium]
MSTEQIQSRKRKIVSTILNSSKSNLLSKIETLLAQNQLDEEKQLTDLEKQEISISRKEISSGKLSEWKDVKNRLASEV